MRGCQGSPGGAFASLFLFLDGSDSAQVAADVDPIISILKCKHLLYAFFFRCSHSPGRLFLFTRTQDSIVYSLTVVLGPSLLGHSHGVCKRISLVVGELIQTMPAWQYLLTGGGSCRAGAKTEE